MSSFIPHNRTAVTDGKSFTREWYEYLRRLDTAVFTPAPAQTVYPPYLPPVSGGGSCEELVVQDATTARTLGKSDVCTVIEFTSASAVTVNLPNDATGQFEDGAIVHLVQGGSGQLTVVPAVGVTVEYSDSLKSRTQESTIGLKRVSANKWQLFGDTEPVAPARSALIRSANSAGVPAYVAPTADGQVLKRSSGTLVFGALTAAEVTNTPAGNIAATTVQTALNELDTEKQVVITGGATTITTSNLTVSRALVSDGSGKVGVATTTATEIGYVNGVTSAIQTQLNGKQAALTSGIATMVAGTVTVNTAAVTATTRIMLTTQVLGTVTAPKAIAVTARVASTSFTITSEDATDTSDVAWVLVQA